MDGVLYIYKDEEKTDMLGSYSCINKNTVTSETSNYSNCFIASNDKLVNSNEQDGYIPIINNNYV